MTLILASAIGSAQGDRTLWQEEAAVVFGPKNGVPTLVQSDPTGNVYAAAGNGRQFVKLSLDGQQLWIRNAEYPLKFITADASGVHTTGWDSFTLTVESWDASGDRRWRTQIATAGQQAQAARISNGALELIIPAYSIANRSVRACVRLDPETGSRLVTPFDDSNDEYMATGELIFTPNGQVGEWKSINRSGEAIGQMLKLYSLYPKVLSGLVWAPFEVMGEIFKPLFADQCWIFAATTGNNRAITVVKPDGGTWSALLPVSSSEKLAAYSKTAGEISFGIPSSGVVRELTFNSADGALLTDRSGFVSFMSSYHLIELSGNRIVCSPTISSDRYAILRADDLSVVSAPTGGTISFGRASTSSNRTYVATSKPETAVRSAKLLDGSVDWETSLQFPTVVNKENKVAAVSSDGYALVATKVEGSSLQMLKCINPHGVVVWQRDISQYAECQAWWSSQDLVCISLGSPAGDFTDVLRLNLTSGVEAWAYRFPFGRPQRLEGNLSANQLVCASSSRYGVINLTTGALIRNLGALNSTYPCTDLEIDADGSLAAMRSGSEVRRFSATGVVLWTVNLAGVDQGYSPLARDPTGNYVVVSTGTDNSTTLRRLLRANGAISVWATLTNHSSVAAANDSTRMYVRSVNAGNAYIRAYSLTNGALVYSTPYQSSDGSVALLYTSNGQPTVFEARPSPQFIELDSAGQVSAVRPGPEASVTTVGFGGVAKINGQLISPTHYLGSVRIPPGPELDLHALFGLHAAERRVLASNFTITLGEVLVGGLEDLSASDDAYLELLSDGLSNRVHIDFGFPMRLPVFRVDASAELQVGRLGLASTLSVLTANGWVSVGGAVVSGTDMPVTGYYLNTGLLAGTSEGRARLTLEPVNDEDPAQDGWLARIDHVNFSLW